MTVGQLGSRLQQAKPTPPRAILSIPWSRWRLTLLRIALRLTLLRYQAGEATALEVVDAQNTVALARNAYDEGLSRYRVAQANIQTLTGSL